MVKKTEGKKGGVYVTFVIECEEEPFLKGSWDNWKEHKMRKRKDGKYSFTKKLKKGEYEFGYLCGGRWMVDEGLPRVANPFGGENSFLVID